MNEAMKTAVCRVCGGPVTMPYLDGVRDYEFGDIDWLGEIRGCSACTLLQQYPMLSEQEALAFYPDSYTHYNFSPSALRKALMSILEAWFG